MLTYLLRRLLWLVPVLLVISLVTFFLMHSIPGNPFDQEDKPLPPEVIARLEAHYHLDEPVWAAVPALHGRRHARRPRSLLPVQGP